MFKLSFSRRICMLLLLAHVMLSSCSHYLDQTTSKRTWRILQGKMEMYPDSNILTYKDNTIWKADGEVSHPIPFHIRLPKNIVFVQFVGIESLAFYYKKRQAIVVWIDIDDGSNKPDSFYIPSAYEIDSLKSKNTHPSDKYDISDMQIITERKQFMIRTKGAHILLFNIKQKNYKSFLNAVQTFKFL